MGCQQCRRRRGNDDFYKKGAFVKKVLVNKELSKDVLQGIGYFVLIAGLIRLSVPVIRSGPLYLKLLFVIFLLWLIWFVSIYILIHVIRPIVKLYHPEFTMPEIDPNHIVKSGIK